MIHGTCFYVRAGAETFLITNQHNLFLSYADLKYSGYKVAALLISGYFGVEQYAECLFATQTLSFATPQNPAEDVVVLDLTGVHFQFRRKRKAGEDPTQTTSTLSPIALAVEMLATEKDFTELRPGDAIVFPSYPALYDQNGVRPLMRAGTIASDPESNYQTVGDEPARRVVCDAHSTEGSSGSPVYCLKESKALAIGINAGHLTGNEPKIGTIHSGLSFCFKSGCILECIEKLQSKRPPIPQQA